MNICQPKYCQSFEDLNRTIFLWYQPPIQRYILKGKLNMSDLRLIWEKMKEMKGNMKESVPFVMFMTVLHIYI